MKLEVADPSGNIGQALVRVTAAVNPDGGSDGGSGGPAVQIRAVPNPLGKVAAQGCGCSESGALVPTLLLLALSIRRRRTVPIRSIPDRGGVSSSRHQK